MGFLVSKRLDFNSPKLNFDLKRNTILFFLSHPFVNLFANDSWNVCALNVFSGSVFESEMMHIKTEKKTSPPRHL